MSVPNPDGWKRRTKAKIGARVTVGAVQAEDAGHHWGKATANETTSRAG